MSALHCPTSNSAAASLPCPGGHAFIVSHAVAPLLIVKRPVAHASHAAALLLDLCRPATHALQVSAQMHLLLLLQAMLLLVSVLSWSCCKLESRHPWGLYEDDSVLAVTSSSPRAQAAASHSALVVMSVLHCPAVNSAPALLVCPGGHVFAVKVSHAIAPLSEMLPFAHASHAAVPLLVLKRPATHVVHMSPQMHG
jgi:hypothetical protein